VRTELAAAMGVGARTLRNGIDDLALAAPAAAEARRLVRVFDGNRHVRAELIDASGTPAEASRPLMPDAVVPRWFLWAVDPRLTPVTAALPAAAGGGRIELTAVADNEASEVWNQYGDDGVTLAAFCLLTSLLIMLVVGRGLRPLASLSAALGRIGAGDYAVRLPPAGAPELARLADGFNRMAEALAAMHRQNQLLREQLLTLQDEERAELARDLHDEIGPYLFCVNISAATIDELLGSERVADIPAQLRDIREAVGHMQRQVSATLRRLRPPRALEFGLDQAIADVVAFWSARHDAIAFRASIGADLDGADETVRDAVYRVVREGLSNAVRHGRPSAIDIVVAREGEAIVTRVSDDGGPAGAPAGLGFGLAGMRERVAMLGGSLIAGPRADGRGWLVAARLPCRGVIAADARAAA
jgi:two-component system sensor histidine kinase UhpB